MRLGPARPRDIRRLVRLIPGAATPADRRALRRLIAEAEVLVLRDWRGPHGFMAREGAEVHALYIHRRQRGRGHGKRLLDAAKRRARVLTLWTPQADRAARAFYAREGFEVVGFGDGSGNEHGLPDVRLRWIREGARP